jgi:hypothetical protein
MIVAYKAPQEKGDGIACPGCVRKLGGPHEGDEPINNTELEAHTFCCVCLEEFEVPKPNENFNLERLQQLSPAAFDALPEPYQNDSCLDFFIDVNGNLCAELDIGGAFLFTDEGKWIEIDDPRVACSMCGKKVQVLTAHLHQGKYIGDECCWDERLRTTE